MYSRVKTTESNKDQTIYQNGDIYVRISFLPYDRLNSTIVYFVSSTKGDEYGQFANAGDAIDRATKVVDLLEDIQDEPTNDYNAPKTFERGNIYVMTFITDSDLKIPYICTHRTKKTVRLEHTETKEAITRKIKTNSSGVEYILKGSYSMAPGIYADKIIG